MPPEPLIRCIAASESSPLFATGLWQRETSVWDFARRARISTFITGRKAGNTALGIQGGQRPLVFARPRRGGLGAFDAHSGVLVWERRDIGPVSHLSVCERTGLVAAGLVGRPLHLLQSSSGELIRTFRGARECYFGPLQDEVLLTADGHRQPALFSLASGKRLRRFAVAHGSLCAGQNRDSVLLTDFGADEDEWEQEPIRVTSYLPGSLTCFSRSGEFLWYAEAPLGSHFLQVAWADDLQLWFAVQWSYVDGGPYIVKAFRPDGRLEHEAAVEDTWEVGFLLGGRFLVTSAGQVLELPSLEVRWQFWSGE